MGEWTIPEEAVEAAMQGWCDFHNRYEGVDGAYQAHDEPERSAVTAALTAAYPHLHAREYALSALRVQAENERLRAQLEAVSQKALDAIAPCVVGWDEMPEWAEALAAVVPDLQDALGIPHSAALSDEGGDDE